MEVDQVHLVIPPRYAVSHVGDGLKANTRRAVSEKLACLKTISWDGDGIGSTGDFVSMVGADEHKVRRDVEM